MESYRIKFLAGSSLLALAVKLSFAVPSQLILGDPPTAPKDVSSLPRQPDFLVTGGFSVNTTNREEVRSFYNAVYSASDNLAMNSSANTASCFAGTNGPAFMDGVLVRINWFRAMAGLSANITFNNTFSTNDQLAALMMSRNAALSHTPPPSWTCFTLGGSNAANNSNIAWGTAGPDAVSGYIQDADSNNFAAGHRRWLLYPQTQLMGTGDVPQQGSFEAANAIWVFDGHVNDPRPSTRNRYVSWPPPGFVPKQVVFPRWSFAYTNANFTSATITMTSNGIPVTTIKETVLNGYGENSIVWVPMGLDSTNYLTLWPFNGTDTVYTAAISNVLFGATVSNFNYTVTVFDPAIPGVGYFPPVVSGPAQPVVGLNNAYTFNSVSNATGYQWRYAQRLAFSLSDGAEAGLANWATNTSSTYSIIATTPVASGTHAFQLGHPNTPPNPTAQIMTLNYAVNPLTNTVLQFKSRLEYATATQIARVQVSTDSGNNWSDVYSQAGDGTSGESSFSTKAISLSNFVGSALQIRFNYDIDAGSYFPDANSIIGWHFDDITITNAEQLLTPVTNSIATTSFQFNPPVAGNYNLQARGIIFTDFPLDWGPAKQVLAVTSAVPIIAINKITVSNNLSKIDFTLQSGSASTYKLLTATQPFGAWSTDNVAVLTTNFPGSYRFTTTPAGNLRFYRVKTP